jgi:hypothetical protein
MMAEAKLNRGFKYSVPPSLTYCHSRFPNFKTHMSLRIRSYCN